MRERSARRRWSVLDPPGYVEAYPRVRITEAWSATRAGTPELLWRDQRDVAVGLASVAWRKTDGAVLYYRVEDLAYLWATRGELRLALVWKGSLESNRQPYALCPACGQAVGLLVLRGEDWRCRRCHQLQNRSRLLASDVRDTEKLGELARRIEATAWSRGDVRALAAAHNALMEKLAGKYVDANSLFAARIEGEWLGPPAGSVR